MRNSFERWQAIKMTRAWWILMTWWILRTSKAKMRRWLMPPPRFDATALAFLKFYPSTRRLKVSTNEMAEGGEVPSLMKWKRWSFPPAADA